MEPISPLASALGTEYHRPILSLIEGHGGRLRKRERDEILILGWGWDGGDLKFPIVQVFLQEWLLKLGPERRTGIYNP